MRRGLPAELAVAAGFAAVALGALAGGLVGYGVGRLLDRLRPAG